MKDSEIRELISEIQEAARLLRSGNRGDALVIYHDVKERTQRSPAVELQLGHLCEEFGDIDEALLHYEIVVEEAPDNVSHLAVLGIAYLNALRYEKARTTLERALELDPDLSDVRHAMGVIFMRGSDYEAALEHLERSCALKPRDPKARVNLATTLGNLNRHDEALEHVEKALKHAPKDPMAHLTKSDILAQIGDMEEATRLVEQLIQNQLDLGAAFDHLARLRKFTSKDAPLMKRAEKALDRGMNPKERRNLLFSLGKMYDDCQDYEKAFSFYSQANLLRKQNFDFAADENLRKASCKAFTAKSIEEFGRNGNPSEQPVFIVGMPRSGTTLMERIIAAHPRGSGAGELPEIPRLARKMVPASEWRKAVKLARETLTPEGLQEHSQSYLDILRQGAGDAERIVDKMPGNSRFVGLIKSMFPNATIIHAMRHPLDSCLSCYFQNFAELWWTNDLKMIGQVYNGYRKSMDYWKQVLPEGSILEVRYEELVGDPETHARRMIEHCNLEWDPSVLEFYRKRGVVRTASIAQTRRKIYKTSRARWMNYAQFIDPLVAEIAPHLEQDRELLAEHGIDLPAGPGWLKRLVS